MNDSSTHTTSLTIWNGQVQLPTADTIPPESAAMAEVLRNALPEGIALPVIASQAASRRGISRWERLGILLGLAVVALAVWLLWPVPFRVTTAQSAGPSQVGSATYHVSSDHATLFRQADKLFGEERYKECVALLEGALPDIMASADSFQANRKFLYLYLNACYKANDCRPECLEHLRRAQEFAPDDLTWGAGAITLEWMPFERHYHSYDRLLAGAPGGKPKAQAARRTHQLKMLRSRVEALLADNARHSDNALTTRQLRDIQLLHCQLLTALWILQGHPRYPDDAQDPGVEERESAYRIACAYGDDMHFLLLRKAIIQTIAQHLSWHDGYYFFNGVKRFKRTYLEEELAEIDLKLATVQCRESNP